VADLTLGRAPPEGRGGRRGSGGKKEGRVELDLYYNAGRGGKRKRKALGRGACDEENPRGKKVMS